MPNLEFANLYRNIRFYLGFKVVTVDGTAINRGLTLPLVWNMREACKHFEDQRRYVLPEIHAQFGQQFESVAGRTLQLPDLRISFCPADSALQAVYLDDVGESIGHVNVETSPGNFQAHFRLSRPCDEVEASAAIRMLRYCYGGDSGAAKARQGRRFITPGLRHEFDWHEDDVSVEDAVRLFPAPTEDDDFTDCLTITTVVLTGAEQSLYRDVWQRKLRSAKGDKSAADFGLAAYVLEKGLSADVAAAAIAAARTTLSADKGCYAGAYVSRTVQAAAKAVKQSQRKILLL
jgi:hypothetical protein